MADALLADALLGDRIAGWAAGLTTAALPEAVLADARLRILDTLASGIAAVAAPPVVAARDAARKLDGGGKARTLGFGDAMTPAWAALVNGTMAHTLDFDDTHPGSSIHVSAPIVSAVVTLGDALGSSGADIVAATVAGSEITARIGAIVPGQFQARGQHPTGIVGTVGAALAAARLLGLSPPAIRNAMGIAVSQASGISESFGDGTWPRRMHAGWAAHSGIAAAHLAASGFNGPARALDGRFGLFKAFLGDASQDYGRLAGGLGSEWLMPKGAFKPYPCGHVIQGFVDCALQLHRQGVRPENIAAITCLASPHMMPLVAEPAEAKRRPDSESGAKGSLHFTVAAAFVHGRLGSEAYEEAELTAPKVLALADRITCIPDPDPPKTRRYKGWIVAETTDGKRHEAIVMDSRGSEANPMTPDEIRQKARDICTPPLPAAQVEQLIALAGRVEMLPDIRALVDACCRKG
jgi:2-methylcitrate dehydratase PrpD